MEFLPKSPQRQREANLSLGKHSRHAPQPQPFHSCPLLPPPGSIPRVFRSPRVSLTPENSSEKQNKAPRAGIAPWRRSPVKGNPQRFPNCHSLGGGEQPRELLGAGHGLADGQRLPGDNCKTRRRILSSSAPQILRDSSGIPLSPSTHRHGQGLIQLPEHLLQESQPEAPRRTAGGSKSS